MGGASAILLAFCWWGAAAGAEEISVPVDYHGEQIQLAGRFEKPVAQGPLPVVILLHNCAGVDGSPSLAVWAPLGTPRCGSIALRRGATTMSAPMEPRYDLASARRTCSPQPTCSPLDPTSDPTGSPYSGFRTAAGLQFMSPEITRSCVPGANGSRRGAASSWRVSLFMAAVAQTPAIQS
jgi:hypothetical protein